MVLFKPNRKGGIFIKHVDSLIKPIGNGATNPYLGTIDNDTYIIKTLNCPEGNKVLVNEFVCYHLAKLVGLPIPDMKLAIIDSDTTFEREVLDSEGNFPNKCFGLAYCSRLITSVALLQPNMITMMKDYETIVPRLVLFDHLICNKDRNAGNLLGTIDSKRNIWVIDHSHVFELQALWNRTQLKMRMTPYDCSSDIVMSHNGFFYKHFKESNVLDMVSLNNAADFFRQNINEKIIKNILDRIPKEWESNNDDIDALYEYLVFRFNHLNDFISTILSYSY